MRDEIVKLKKTLSSLSIKFPLSTELNCLVSRDFSLISQREAYGILRYLLKACGKVVELTEKSFSYARWNSKVNDPDVMRRIEKCKRYVFDAIKDIRQENKVSIPKLKMSDLLVPYCTEYFSTCLALANYALSYQLENHGFYFWPKSEAHISIKLFYSNLKEEECHQFEIQQKNLLDEIDLLESKINKVKEQKKKLDSLLDNEISKCSCALQEESERSRILANWKDETDELHKRNLEKIKNLEYLNEQLALLARCMVKKEKFVINGDELRKNIPFEVENFAEMNGVPLIKENHLDILALFKIVHLSIPKAIKNKEMFRELLSLKLPEINSELLTKLENQKKKLEERCEDFLKHFAKHLVFLCKPKFYQLYNYLLSEDDITEASIWLKNFLFYIPRVEINAMNTTISSRDPIFDEEKLSRFVGLSEKSSQCKGSNIEATARKGKDVLHRIRDFNSKYCKKMNNQTATIKRDSKKQMWWNSRRKSISLIDLSNLSATSIKSVHSEKVDSPCGSETSQKSRKLCSTPKENHNRSFIYDRNISPISVLSNKDKSFIIEARIDEIDIANDSTLNENDVHASLLNSYLSADLDYKSENNKDTFDFSNSTTNITFDSPSGLSINLSNSIS